jgi:hypothetical protein
MGWSNHAREIVSSVRIPIDHAHPFRLIPATFSADSAAERSRRGIIQNLTVMVYLLVFANQEVVHAGEEIVHA